MRRRHALIAAVGLRGATAQAEPALPALRVLCTASQAQLPLKFDRANPHRPGICIEIIQALSRLDTGLRFEGLARELPLKRVVQELANDELDLFFSLIPTEERKRQVDFLDGPPLYESRHQLAVRADDPVDVRSIDDLRALGPMGLVLTTHGTAYSEFLQQFDGIALYPQALSNEQNLRMLLAGRGRFFYHAGSTLRDHIERLGLQNQVRILPTVFKVDEQRVGCSRRLPLTVRQRVTAALQRLWQSGELSRLRQKYGVT